MRPIYLFFLVLPFLSCKCNEGRFGDECICFEDGLIKKLVISSPIDSVLCTSPVSEACVVPISVDIELKCLQKCDVFLFSYVKSYLFDENFHIQGNSTRWDHNNLAGKWETSAQFGANGIYAPKDGEKFSVVVVATDRDISKEIRIKSIRDLEDKGVNIGDFEERIITIKRPSQNCFSTAGVSEFKLNSIVNPVICPSNDQTPCRIKIDGSFKGVTSEKCPGYAILLVQSQNGGDWYIQQELASLTSPSQNWQLTAQLGDIGVYSPKNGEKFNLVAVVTPFGQQILDLKSFKSLGDIKIEHKSTPITVLTVRK